MAGLAGACLSDMKTWEAALISPDLPLREAIARIDRAATQMALVVDRERRLLGTLSDGDVRRAVLAGGGLDVPVERCMSRTPTTAHASEAREAILAKMRRLVLHQIPIVDEQGRVVDLKTIDDYLAPPNRDTWVVIMAGGLGTRLKHLTRDTPKPMLPVGDRPLLETIVGRLVEQGFRQIWLAVNYHADQIEKYFEDGVRFGAEIRYLRETKRLGTVGAVSLLPKAPERPLLVTNADLLATVDYGQLVDAHMAAGAAATMAVRDYEYQIPFGVVRTDGDAIVGMEEKPVHQTLVNAGIYVLAPEAVAMVPRDTYFDMPELFASLMDDGREVRCHNICGYWLDIGRQEDLERASIDFQNNFRL